MTEAVPRPVGVTIVAVLIVLAGIFLVVRGIVGLVVGGEGGAGILVAGLLLVVGLAYLMVAWGVWRGSRLARLAVALLAVLAIVGSVLTLFELGETLSSIVQIAVAAVILVLLFTGSARAYFR